MPLKSIINSLCVPKNSVLARVSTQQLNFVHNCYFICNWLFLFIYRIVSNDIAQNDSSRKQSQVKLRWSHDKWSTFEKILWLMIANVKGFRRWTFVRKFWPFWIFAFFLVGYIFFRTICTHQSRSSTFYFSCSISMLLSISPRRSALPLSLIYLAFLLLKMTFWIFEWDQQLRSIINNN